MRYLKVVFCLVFVAVCHISCNKEEELILVSGKLIDPNQGVDVSDVRVELWAQKIESGIYSAHYESYGSILSKQNGEFSFELENMTYASVKLSFSKDNYYFWEYEIDGDELKSKMAHNETYQMQPKAWIRLVVNNKIPVDGSDYFDLRIMNGITECEDCCTGELLKFQGMVINEDRVCQVIGHQDISVRWNSRKDAVQKGNVELLFVPAFDTTRIDFEF